MHAYHKQPVNAVICRHASSGDHDEADHADHHGAVQHRKKATRSMTGVTLVQRFGMLHGDQMTAGIAQGWQGKDQGA